MDFLVINPKQYCACIVINPKQLESKSHSDIVSQLLGLIRIVKFRFNRPYNAVVTISYAASRQSMSICSTKQIFYFVGSPSVTAPH